MRNDFRLFLTLGGKWYISNLTPTGAVFKMIHSTLYLTFQGNQLLRWVRFALCKATSLYPSCTRHSYRFSLLPIHRGLSFKALWAGNVIFASTGRILMGSYFLDTPCIAINLCKTHNILTVFRGNQENVITAIRPSHYLCEVRWNF